MATAKQRAARRPSKKTAKKLKTPAVVVASSKDQAAKTGVPRATITTVASKTVPASPKAAPDSTKVARRRLPSAWTIGQKAWQLLWSHKVLFGGILLIYVLLSLFLVHGFTSTLNLSSLKNALQGNFSGSFSGVWTGLTAYTVLIFTSNANTSDTVATYAGLLALIMSLAIVWALRQVMAGRSPAAEAMEQPGGKGMAKIRIRDAFYNGMYPLIPVFLLLLLIVAELLPFTLSGYLYGLVTANGIAIHIVEHIIWTLVMVAGVMLTGYWLTSSLIALYIVTLPGMTPLQALRSARKLVRGRRWPLIRKLLALPLGLFLASAVIMVPVILLFAGAAPTVFFFLALVGLFVVHAYMYTLYRELLS